MQLRLSIDSIKHLSLIPWIIKYMYMYFIIHAHTQTTSICAYHMVPRIRNELVGVASGPALRFSMSRV